MHCHNFRLIVSISLCVCALILSCPLALAQATTASATADQAASQKKAIASQHVDATTQTHAHAHLRDESTTCEKCKKKLTFEETVRVEKGVGFGPAHVAPKCADMCRLCAGPCVNVENRLSQT